jgi:hypothetical protein
MAEASGIGGGGGHRRAVPVGSASILALVSPPVAAPVAGPDRGLWLRLWIVRIGNARTGGPGSSGRETAGALEVNAVNPKQSRRFERKAPVDRKELGRVWAKLCAKGLGWLRIWVGVIGLGLVHCGATEAEPTAEAQGRQWAQRLRTVAPEQPSTNQAVLKIRSRDGRKQVPLTVVTRPGKEGWWVEYQTGPETAGGKPEIWRIHYSNDAPPRFESPTAQPAHESGGSGVWAGDLRIAGSDFLLRELGMEFLHWPEQRIRGRELSNGRWCQVLESVSKRPDGPATVRSWIDEKLGVVLSAEVYDARQVRLKHFSITQFREQADRWTCSVSMVDDVKGTKTELAFDGAAPR